MTRAPSPRSRQQQDDGHDRDDELQRDPIERAAEEPLAP
jgi:hypothetical protein